MSVFHLCREREDGHLVMKAQAWRSGGDAVVRGQEGGHTRSPSPSHSPNPQDSTVEASSQNCDLRPGPCADIR